MDFVVTHNCIHCGASHDRRDLDNIKTRRGAPRQDCLLDINKRHNYQHVGMLIVVVDIVILRIFFIMTGDSEDKR